MNVTTLFYNETPTYTVTTQINKLAVSITFPISTARPAIQSGAYLPLTIVLIILYSLIFFAVYFQLILILYYKHKRYSYQTALLFLCLIWSTLRIVLFSFYFNNAKDANQLIFIFYFCLYCLPVVLQFCILCLLVLYYGQLYFKISNRINQKRNSILLRSTLTTCVIIFFFTNLASAFYTREYCTFGSDSGKCNLFQTALVRVIINDLLYIVFGIILSVYLFKIAKLSKLYGIPEHHKISICKAVIITMFTPTFLITRTIYNLSAIIFNKLPEFGFDWINVSDQADLVNLTETKKFITFSVVLLVWELIPTSVVVILFRLRQNKYSYNANKNINTLSSSLTKSVFLDEEPKDDLEDSIASATIRSIIDQSYNQDFVRSGTTSPNLMIHGSI